MHRDFVIRFGVLEQYTGSDPVVTVPADVKEIGEKCFEALPVEQVILPEGLQKIRDSAFYNCRQLREINLPDSLLYIGKYAFSYCEAMTKVTVPAGIRHISFKAFFHCGMQALTLSEGVASVGDEAFGSCIDLGTVSLPSTLRTIGTKAFARGALTAVTIPGGVAYIGSEAFTTSMRLTSVTVADSVTEVGSNVFGFCPALDPERISVPVPQKGTFFDADLVFQGYCSRCGRKLVTEGTQLVCKACGAWFDQKYYSEPHGRLAESIEENGKLPTGTLRISKGVLEGFTGDDDEVTIPDCIKSIAPKAFYGNAHLVKVTIPESVERIGAEAFRGCTALTSVTMPDTVFVEIDAFRDCKALDPEQTHISENVQNRVLAGTGFMEKGYCEYCGGRIHYAALFWICSRCGKVYRD